MPLILRRYTQHDMRYILGVKEGDHAFLFAASGRRLNKRVASPIMTVRTAKRGMHHRFRFVCGISRSMRLIPHSASTSSSAGRRAEGKVQHCSWVTDLRVNKGHGVSSHAGGAGPLAHRK